MTENDKILALITARGGSKRLPRKNILDFNGMPMIAWSIEAALQSAYLDQVVVSTDDEEIAEVARNYSARVPFMRPKDLSDDSAKSIDVALHAIESLKQCGEEFDYLVILQPTSPLRQSHHIDDAIQLLQDQNADCVIGMTEVEHPIEWVTSLPESNSLDGFFSSDSFTLSQSGGQAIVKHYIINGAIYICNIKRMMRENTLFLKSNSYAYLMDRDVSVDIDTKYDFELAKILQKI